MDIWALFTICAIILLVIFWRARNAVWGGLTLGIVFGFIVAVFFIFKGKGFEWELIGKFAVSGTLVGFAVELLGKISDYLKKKG